MLTEHVGWRRPRGAGEAEGRKSLEIVEMTESYEATGTTGHSSLEVGGDPPCWAGSLAGRWDNEPSPARPDLTTRAHVHDLVVVFYREIVFDEVLEPIFGEVAEVDWVEHLPRLIDYWCSILFGTENPTGSVTKAHRRLHDLAPIEREHCDRWFALWCSSVDQGWEGPNAERIKHYAGALMAGLAKRVFGFSWSPDPRCSPNHESPMALGPR